MDSLDQEGSLSEMGSLLVQGRLRWRDEAKFYARVGRDKSDSLSPPFLPS